MLSFGNPPDFHLGSISNIGTLGRLGKTIVIRANTYYLSSCYVPGTVLSHEILLSAL